MSVSLFFRVKTEQHETQSLLTKKRLGGFYESTEKEKKRTSGGLGNEIWERGLTNEMISKWSVMPCVRSMCKFV